MRIPVFLSSPTSLSTKQEAVRNRVVRLLNEFGMEPRALGRQEYPTDCPLREVAVIAKHCSGGVILGFEQFKATEGVSKPGTINAVEVKNQSFPTPWNNLEAGILFALGLPLLIFREDGINGGVFDSGVTDAFVNKMPSGRVGAGQHDELRELVLKWQAKVRETYYKF